MKRKSIKEYLEDDRLDFINAIYSYAEDRGIIISDELRKELKIEINKKEQKEQKEVELDSILDKLENENLKDEILKIFRDYSKVHSEIRFIEVEEYFKVGFKSGIKFMIEK